MHKCKSCGFVGSISMLKAGKCPMCDSHVEKIGTSVEDVNAAVAGLGSAFEALKVKQSVADQQVKDNGFVSALTNLELQRITGVMVTQEETLAAIKAKQDRPPVNGGETDEANDRKKFLMNEYIRKGITVMDPAHVKEMTVTQQEFVTKGLTESTLPTAGFLVRPEQQTEILKGINEISPIRQISRVIQIGSLAVEFPKRTGQFAAVWEGETGPSAETTGLTFGIERIPVNNLRARVDLTHNLLEDAFVNLEAFLNEEFIEQFMLAEGTAFVTGTGIGRAEGFTINPATLAAATTSGTSNALNADDFSELFIGQLKEPYWANATWVMNRTTLRDAMQLKDGNSQFIWQPGLAAGIPGTILGRPFIMATDMPAVATGAEALAIGDFRRGYLIVDRIGINMQRITDVSTMEAGGVAIFARKRLGAQVIISEAIKLLTIQ